MIGILRFVLEEFAEKACRPDQETVESLSLSGIGYRDLEPSLGIEWLRAQGEDFTDRGDSLRLASHEVHEERLATARRYKTTAKGKAAVARYRDSDKAKAADRARHQRNDARRDLSALYARRKELRLAKVAA
jgi:hypothetical protein